MYVEPVIKKDNKNYIITYEPNYKKLKDLNTTELRNIPSYSINENKFFSEYELNEEFNNTDILNIRATEYLIKDDIKRQLFTDNYQVLYQIYLKIFRLNQIIKIIC